MQQILKTNSFVLKNPKINFYNKLLPENTEGILYIKVLTVFIGTPFKGSCIFFITAWKYFVFI